MNEIFERKRKLELLVSNSNEIQKTLSLPNLMLEYANQGNFDKCISLYAASFLYKTESQNTILAAIKQKASHVICQVEQRINDLLKSQITLSSGIQLLTHLRRIKELQAERGFELSLSKQFIYCRNVYLNSLLDSDFDGKRQFYFDLISLFKLVFPTFVHVLSSFLIEKFAEMQKSDAESLIYFAGAMARVGWDMRPLLVARSD